MKIRRWILAGTCIMILSMGMIGMTAAADGAETSGETITVSESDVPADTPDEGQTEEMYGQLVIDDEHIYPGMGQPYKKGYIPKADGGTATIIIPLTAEENSDITSVRVTPNLGASENSPFVYKNYQKTFYKTDEKIDGGSQTCPVFLIRFDLALSTDRINGIYPVTMMIEYTSGGQPMTQSLTSYVQITDGRSGEETEAVPQTEAETKPTSEPKVILSKCEDMPEKIYAGESFSVKAVLENTNTQKRVQNMTVTVSCDAPGVSLMSDSNVFYYDSLGAGGTLELPLEFFCDETCEQGKYTVNLSMSYDNPDALSLTSEATFNFSVEQKMEVELEVGTLAEEINAGDQVVIPVQAINLGRGSVFNARCTLEVPGLSSGTSLFLGNMEGGSALSGEIQAFAGMVNEDAASESERYGRTSGVITLSYEDAAGEIYTVEKELTVQINPLQMNTMLNTETSEDTDMTGQLIAAAAAAAGIIVIGTMIPLLIRRRRRRKDDEA